MGWERKRGKIEEFNRLLRGATDTSFTVQVGELDILPSVRYCITLDTDTRLPRDAAKTLIGIIAHPLNRPRFDARRRPRHRGLRHPAAARQRDDGQRRRLAVRAHLRRPHRRRPVHHRRLGRLPGSLRRGHLHRQGPLRRRRVHRGARRAACRRTRCCRTTSSRASTRGPRSSPTSRSSTTIRRASSRTRDASTAGCAATGRSCWWLFPFVPSRAGFAAQPPAAHLALEDPRQPAPQPDGAGDGRAARCSAGPSCPGSPLVWTRDRPRRARLSRRARALLQLLRGPRRIESWSRVPAHRRRRSRAPTPRASALQLTFLANQAYEMAARDRRDARAPRASPSAGCSSGRRPRRAPPRRGLPRVRAFLVEHDRQPARSPRPASCSSLVVRPHALPRRAAGARAVGGRAAHRVRASRPVPTRRAGARRRQTASYLDGRRAQDVALLRDVRRRRGSRAAARQRPDRPGADDRAPHVADQHRHGAARDARGARPRLHRHRRAGRAGSTPRSRRSKAWSASKATC